MTAEGQDPPAGQSVSSRPDRSFRPGRSFPRSGQSQARPYWRPSHLIELQRRWERTYDLGRSGVDSQLLSFQMRPSHAMHCNATNSSADSVSLCHDKCGGHFLWPARERMHQGVDPEPSRFLWRGNSSVNPDTGDRRFTGQARRVAQPLLFPGQASNWISC